MLSVSVSDEQNFIRIARNIFDTQNIEQGTYKDHTLLRICTKKKGLQIQCGGKGRVDSIICLHEIAGLNFKNSIGKYTEY